MDLLDYIEDQKARDSHPAGVPADVAMLFEKIALQLVDEGFKRFSADAIVHQIRWTHRTKWIAGDFRCNDHWVAPLARWFLDRHPNLKEQKFFELRQTRAEAA